MRRRVSSFLQRMCVVDSLFKRLRAARKGRRSMKERRTKEITLLADSRGKISYMRPFVKGVEVFKKEP